jgi:very-short-patch-repair endonuclease
MRRYNLNLKLSARTLRSTQTDSEQRLWSRLRHKQILEVQFYRQKPIGKYIVDFYAPRASLITEVDGAQHLEPSQARYEQRRTAYMEHQGLHVLRFTNVEVLQKLDAVIEEIFRVIQERKSLRL